MTISPSTLALTFLGESVRLTASVRDQNGQPFNTTVVWSSADPSVATTSASGDVTAAGNGTTTVNASAGSASAAVAVTVQQVASQVTIVSGDGQTETVGAALANPLVAQSSDAGGTGSVHGSLVLHEQSEDLQRFAGGDGSAIPGVASPLFGTTDLGVETVGALRVGDLSSADPAAPGVLVIESETARGPSILLRFGSDANRRDRVRFDGGFTVLELREIGSDGFSGAWTSGAQRLRAAGYFCAERVSD